MAAAIFTPADRRAMWHTVEAVADIAEQTERTLPDIVERIAAFVRGTENREVSRV